VTEGSLNVRAGSFASLRETTGEANEIDYSSCLRRHRSDLAAPAQLAAQVPIKEWPVPYPDSRPRDPYVDGKDRVWFVGQVGNYLAYLEPESGTFKRYELENGALPHNLIVDPKGMVWYAGNGNGHIGSGQIWFGTDNNTIGRAVVTGAQTPPSS